MKMFKITSQQPYIMRQSVKRQGLVVNKIEPELLLTKLVQRRLEKLPILQKHFFSLYISAKRAEHLPNGIPYKVVSDPNFRLAVFVWGVNKPLILVNERIKSYRARQVAARHEYNEWGSSLSAAGSRQNKFGSSSDLPAHKRAIKAEHDKETLRKLLDLDPSLVEK